MRKTKLGLLALVAGAAISVGVLADAGPAAAAGKTLHGCPYGAFCIYPESKHPPRRTLPKGPPERGGIYYTYGYHNLYRQFGWHFVFNNQYGGAGVSFCNGYNGTGGEIQGQRSRSWGLIYLTPVNSITLWLYNYHYDSEVVCHM